MSSPRIVSIQWLRALAATLVLVVHAADMIDHRGVATTGKFAPSVPNLGVFGVSGVDLFFVISGFAMAQSLSTAGHDPWHFLKMRWLRIVPLFACLSAAYMIIMPDPLTLQSALMSITVLPVFDGADYQCPALSPGWTLGFEFAFYMLVAIAMRVPRHRVGALLALTLAVAVAGLFVTAGWAPLRLMFNPLLLEFALGIAVWIAWRRGVTAHIAAPALVAGVALLAVGICFGLGIPVSVNPEAAVAGNSGIARTWTWGIPWSLVVIGLVDTRSHGPIGSFIARIGDASYSTYLSHAHLLALLWMAGRYLPVFTPTAFVATFVAISMTLGLAVHRWIERPLLARLHRRSHRQLYERAALA